MATNVYGLQNDSIAANADILATKLEHQYVRTESYPGPVDSDERIIHRVFGTTGSLLSIAVVVDDVPTGADELEIDLLVSSGGGAWTSRLSAPLVIDSGSVARVPQTATPQTVTLQVGDLFKITVTATGTTAANLAVVLTWREKAA